MQEPLGGRDRVTKRRLTELVKSTQYKKDRSRQWLESKGLLHHCQDGRTGVLNELEQMTDEGVIFRLTCNTCHAVVRERLEAWTDSAKARYQEFKQGRVIRMPVPEITRLF